MRDLPHLLREAEPELAEADGTLYAPGSRNDAFPITGEQWGSGGIAA